MQEIDFAYLGMEETDWAYLAGIVDGEGCIDFRVDKGGHTTPRLQVVTTDERLYVWLQKRLHGSVSKRPKYNLKWKQSWVWTRTGRSACDIVQTIRPYLVLKREQADVMADWMQRTNLKQNTGGRWQMASSDRQDGLNAVAVTKIRDLNRRGVAIRVQRSPRAVSHP